MFSVAICDNEAVICSSLEKTILEYEQIKYGKTKSNIEMFYDGNKLIEYITQGNRFDLIFLDIEMNGINGVEVGKYIRKQMNDYITQIVYISGKQQYAMELFQNQPLNFLLKPIDEKRVIECLNLAIEKAEISNVFFEYSIQREHYRVLLKNIIYLQSDNKKIRMMLNDSEVEFKGKLSDYSALLLNNNFLQIHKSYFVNYQYVARMRYESVTLSNGTVLPISQQYRKEVREMLMNKRKREMGNVSF